MNKSIKRVFYLSIVFLLTVFLANTALSTYQIASISHGAYVRDANATLTADFYDPDVGLKFDGVKTYEKGDFTTYTWLGDNLTLMEADILMDATYNNVQCLLCSPNPPLSNPSHDMSEAITINSSKIRYYEDGLDDAASEALKMAIDADAIKYTINTDYIPLGHIPTGDGGYIDTEYRGKIMFLGREYYLKNVDADKIYLSKGKVLDDVSSEGYFIEYHDYKFKVSSLVYDEDCTNETLAMVMDVKKPDETVVEVESPINKSEAPAGVVDDLEIRVISGDIINDTLSEGTINITNTSDGSSALLNINNTGYVPQWGYNFKVNHIITDCTLAKGIILYVKKPDESVVHPVIVNATQNAVVDDLEIAGIFGELIDDVGLASIIVYDTTTQVVLEDGADAEVDGIEYDGWKVEWKNFAGNCSELSCGIAEYENSSADVLEKIEITLVDDVKGVDALEVDESLLFPGRFRLKFMGYLNDKFGSSDCSGGCSVVIVKGNDHYTLFLSFIGNNDRVYYDVMLDEGAFWRGDMFVLDGDVNEFNKYKKTSGLTDRDDNVTITLKNMMDLGYRTVTLNRLCDPEGIGASTFADCTVGDKPTCNCTGIDDLSFRMLALTDAMDDNDSDKYENDDEVILEAEDLFWAQDSATNQNLVMWFEENSNVIFYATDENDRWLTIEPNMVNPGASSTNDTYKMDYFSLENRKMWVVRECDLANDVNATSRNVTCDLNNDDDATLGSNDDDLLIVFESGSGNEYMVVDLTDRGYDEGATWKYDNRIGLYSNWSNANRTDNANNLVAEYDDDISGLMKTPSNGDMYTIDWGVDNEIDSVGICYPAHDIGIERGSDVYQLTLNFTGEDGNRYVEIRLDEGPFSEGYSFVLDGDVNEFNKYKKDAGTFDKDDNVTITLELQKNRSNRTVTLNRLCDPAGSGASTFADCTVGDKPTCNCTGIDDIEIRKIALYDAIEDGGTDYERDDNVTLEPEDLFWAQDSATNQNLVMWFEENSNVIFYATDEDDRWITIEPNMVTPGANITNDTYKMKSQNMKIWILRECNFTGDVDGDSVYDVDCDWNLDGNKTPGDTTGNDDDLLVIFESGDEYVVLDTTDRGYDEGVAWGHDNGIGLYYSGFRPDTVKNENNKIVYIDEDVDTLLITPLGGSEYIMDWGVDERWDTLSLCHPKDVVNATYFIGLRPIRTTFRVANDQVEMTANQTEIVNLSEIGVTLEIVTGANVNANVNATIYSDAESYFDDVYFESTLGANLPGSTLGVYAEITADNALINNLTYLLIKVYYDEDEVAAANITESDLKLYRYNETTDVWVPLTAALDWVFDAGVDTTNNYIWANTSKFSLYGIGGEETTTTTTTTTSTTTTTLRTGGSSGGSSSGGPSYGAKPLPSCFDGIENCHDGSCEEGVDCGGTCDPCMSCSDGIQNQGEEGIDCGGPCDPCSATTTVVKTTIAPTTTLVTTTTEFSVTSTIAETTTTTVAGKGDGGIPWIIIVLVAMVAIVVLLSVVYIRVRGKR
jgi:hypothetical protein